MLIGGPLSGQIRRVTEGAHRVTGIDGAGGHHVDVRTKLAGTDEDQHLTMFRPVVPERPVRRPEGRRRGGRRLTLVFAGADA